MGEVQVGKVKHPDLGFGVKVLELDFFFQHFQPLSFKGKVSCRCQKTGSAKKRVFNPFPAGCFLEAFFPLLFKLLMVVRGVGTHSCAEMPPSPSQSSIFSTKL